MTTTKLTVDLPDDVGISIGRFKVETRECWAAYVHLEPNAIKHVFSAIADDPQTAIDKAMEQARNATAQLQELDNIIKRQLR